MTQRPPMPVEYYTPPPPAPRPITSISLTLGLFFVAGLITFLTILVVPTYESILMDFAAPVPAATMALLAFTRWFTTGGWLLVWVSALIVPVMVAQLTYRRNRAWAVPWRMWVASAIITMVLVTGVCLYLVMALFLPVHHVMRAVQ